MTAEQKLHRLIRLHRDVLAISGSRTETTDALEWGNAAVGRLLEPIPDEIIDDFVGLRRIGQMALVKYQRWLIGGDE